MAFRSLPSFSFCQNRHDFQAGAGLMNLEPRWRVPKAAAIAIGSTSVARLCGYAGPWPEPARAHGKGAMKMAALRHLSPLLFSLLVAIFVLAMASAVDAASPDSERTGGAERAPNPELMGGWHFVRTRDPHGGTDAISITHTADTSRSDLDLAGLMIRCSERGPEAVIVLIRTFPLRARPHVMFGKPENETKFEATVAQ